MFKFAGISLLVLAITVCLPVSVEAQTTLVINELMASNGSIESDPQGQFDDWIEIHNFGNTAINISGLYLTDDLNNPTKWQFPSSTTILAGGYLLVWADGDTTDTGLHANFKLDAGGEAIGLFDTDGTLIDSITFGEQTIDISYGRFPDAADNWQFYDTPTPAAQNSSEYSSIVEDPEFSHERGFYERSFRVTIATETDRADIYYTTDGSEPVDGTGPSATTSEYINPIYINSTTCIRATAVKTGWIASRTITHTYIFGAGNATKSIPVVSLVGDEHTTFFEPDGIMAIVGGYYSNGVWRSSGQGSYNNPIQRGIEYERPVSFEVIDSQTGTDAQVDCGIRVAGSDYHRPRYTRGDNWDYNYDKFSFKLFLRSTYGDDILDYPIFPLADDDNIKSVSLRGGHNDVHNPFIKDEMLRRLHQDMGGVAVTGTVANLFLNGEYKSFYNPCGRLDHDFFRDYYNVDTDWDVITQRAVRNGDSEAWNATLNFFRSHNLAITSNYEQAGQLIDIVDFIDYLIIELYSANWDWPNNNWTVSRERTPQGKFRFHCWDMEGTMETQYTYTFGFDDFPSWGPGGLNRLESPCGWLYRALKANDEFRTLFADRIQKHFFNNGALTPENVEKRFTELREQMSQVLPGMETSILTNWIPNRHQAMLDKFTDEGLFPSQGPEFQINDSSQHGGRISPTDRISMIIPASISYTDYELLAERAPVRAYVPVDNSLGLTWTSPSFVPDSSWIYGTTGVGYERGNGYQAWIGTDVENQMYGESQSLFVRVEFDYDRNQDFDRLTLQMRYDDGFVAYLNGTEVFQSGNVYNDTPGEVSVDNHEAGNEFENFDITDFKHLLATGTNVLAVHGINTSRTSSDMLVMPRLVGQFVNVTYSSAPIWYTIDGSDPRLPGGGINPTAVEYTGPFTISESRCIKARALDNGTWSALNEAVYAVGQVAESLRITEIMYNPQLPTDGEDPNEEFIELTNISSESINLNLVSFTNGIDFTFSDIELAPGEYVVVVENIDAFESRYGTNINIAGQYTGKLNNNGERIRLEDAIGTTILDFSYSDNWHSITDGESFSLTIIDPANPDAESWDYKDSWRASAYINGSPGYDDSGIIPNPGAVVINELLANSPSGDPDWIELYNTTTTSIDIGGWFLSDSGNDPTKYRIAEGTTIGPNRYIVFYQDEHFDNEDDPGTIEPFALSNNGESVILSSADGDILTGYRNVEDFGPSQQGVSFGRYYKTSTDNYNFVAMEQNTPGTENSYPKVGLIVINEIMYNPDWPVEGSYTNSQYEYIELYNISAESVDLQGWKFTDGIDYTFPEDAPATIPAGGYILVVRHPDAFSWRYPSVAANKIFGPYDGRLSDAGESVELGMPNGDTDDSDESYYIRIDRVSYSDGSHPEDCPGRVDFWPIEADGNGSSLNRINSEDYGNDPDNWQASNPTPGY